RRHRGPSTRPWPRSNQEHRSSCLDLHVDCLGGRSSLRSSATPEPPLAPATAEMHARATSAHQQVRLRSPHSSLIVPVRHVLISPSTPADRSSFISASRVCCVGSRMSSSRLCVRISNCSRDFLSTCGERSTQYLLILVGRGIGPATLAPVRLAVSTIS